MTDAIKYFAAFAAITACLLASAWCLFHAVSFADRAVMYIGRILKSLRQGRAG